MKRICTLILLSVMLALYLASPLLAADTAHVVRPNTVAYVNSSAYQDILRGLGDDPGKMEQYKASDKKTAPEFITAAEYGFYGKRDNSANYRLYIYIYNPSGTELSATGNTITLATRFSDQAKTDIASAGALAYKTFALTPAEVTETDETGETKKPSDDYKTTLYKYYVDLHRLWENAGNGVGNMISGNSRRYDISMVTIGGQAINVANSLICTGLLGDPDYAMTWKDIHTLGLDVTPVVYRHMTDGEHNTQVNSVYFTVPEKYWQENAYELTEIMANWREKRTTPILVTNDAALNDEYVSKGVLGKNVADLDVERSVYAGIKGIQNSDRVRVTSWVFNGKENDRVVRNKDVLVLTALYWMFYKNETDLKDVKVTSAEMLEWYNTHPDWQDKMLTDDITNVNLNNRNGALFKKDDSISIAGRSVDGFQQWWENLLGMKYNYNNITDISSIQCITEEEWANVAALTDETMSQTYLISEDELGGFREAMKKMVADNKTGDKRRMVVFHFAVTDYATYKCVVGAGYGPWDDRNNYHNIAYAAAEDVFLDFQIIYMTFSNDTSRLVVPTVMSPIDIIPGVDPPPDMADNIMTIWNDAVQSWWKKLQAWFEGAKEQAGRVLAIILGLVLIAVCWPLITAALRVVASVIRGIGRGANHLLDAAKRRNTNKHKKE